MTNGFPRLGQATHLGFPADTWRNNNVIITSKRRRFDITMTFPWEKKMATVTAHRELTVTKMVTASRDWVVTWAVIELWPSRDWAVIELWPHRDWAVTKPWLSCDLAVTELWPSLAVTEPWSWAPEPWPPWSPWAHGDHLFSHGLLLRCVSAGIGLI